MPKTNIQKIPGSSGRWKELYRVQSSTRPGLSYIVGKTVKGEYGCSCPAWIFHTPRKDCKHIALVQAKLQQADAQIPEMSPTEVRDNPVLQKAVSRFALVEV